MYDCQEIYDWRSRVYGAQMHISRKNTKEGNWRISRQVNDFSVQLPDLIFHIIKDLIYQNNNVVWIDLNLSTKNIENQYIFPFYLTIFYCKLIYIKTLRMAMQEWIMVT